MELPEIQEVIKQADIDSIRIDFPDIHGICRSKLIPARRLEATLEEGLNFAEATYIVDFANDIAFEGGCGGDSGWSDMTARPDLETFAILPHQPHTARIIANTFLKGVPHPVDPRGTLKKILEIGRASCRERV